MTLHEESAQQWLLSVTKVESSEPLLVETELRCISTEALFVLAKKSRLESVRLWRDDELQWVSTKALFVFAKESWLESVCLWVETERLHVSTKAHP